MHTNAFDLWPSRRTYEWILIETYLIDLAVGAIANDLDELKDASRILEKTNVRCQKLVLIFIFYFLVEKLWKCQRTKCNKTQRNNN